MWTKTCEVKACKLKDVAPLAALPRVFMQPILGNVGDKVRDQLVCDVKTF